jgi:beta-glucanase (GH16 family)
MSTTRKIDWIAPLMLALVGCGGLDEPEPVAIDGNWTLVWEDDFDGEAGTALDPDLWTFDVGGHGWGNNQLEHNTDRTDNAALDGDGNLAIVARREAYEGNDYTSARITTRGMLEPTYGRFEARIKLPQGQGIWPAFWLLGSDIDAVGWPQCGEIDIMEYRGQEPWLVHGALHGPGYSGNAPITDSYVLEGTGNFYDDFHVFRVDWSPSTIVWYVDDVIFQVVELASLPGDNVFDHPFFLLLNLAVGGSYVGAPDETTPFPQTMLVDYVRVYEAAPNE